MSKVIMLTSSTMCSVKDVKGNYSSVKMPEKNQFLANIRDNLKARRKMLYIMANPYRYELNDNFFRIQVESFKLSGLDFEEYVLIDYRYQGNLKEDLKTTDLILLGGGDCEPQLAYFEILNLKELLNDYNGLIIGRSAGSMDMADTVYTCPEFEYQLGDRKYAKGLGFTNIMTLPHYNLYQYYELGGRKLIDDIVMKDIGENILYVLEDGAYILIKDGKSTAYGNTYLLTSGTITKVCSDEQTYIIKTNQY